MVQVEKTDPPNVTVRGIGSFSVGDTADVDADAAEYLVEERGDFEYVTGDGPADAETESPEDDVREEDGPPDEPQYSIVTDDGEQLTAAEATVDEIEAAIADVDDADALRYMLDAERDGQNRTTAIEAIEKRLEELEN
jgi:hypothetical protein